MKRILIVAICSFLIAGMLPAKRGYASREYSDQEKLTLIKKYAPQVLFDKNEKYFPSSVEWSFQYMERYKPEGSNKYSLKTKPTLKDPNGKLDFFSGNLGSAPIYALWKEVNPSVVDIKYAIWYPYNRGKVSKTLEDFAKTFLGMKSDDIGLGHHVGDWEGVTIRLEEGKPTRVQLNYHSWNKKYNWNDFDKVDQSHMIAYSAQGSHGMWKDTGTHNYYDIKVPVLGKIDVLQDHTSKGIQWNTWNNIVGFDLTKKKDLSGNDLPNWMVADATWTEPGKDASDPSSGGIDRWGNTEAGCNNVLSDLSGECILSNGPTGIDESSTFSSGFGITSSLSDYKLGMSIGGNGGGSFNDLSNIPSNPKIKEISIQTGSKVDQISVTYTNGTTLKHGGNGGGKQTITLQSDEYVTESMFCTDDKYVTYASMKTNNNRQIKGGTIKGKVCRLIETKNNEQIIGFWGQSGSLIDQIGSIIVAR